MRMRGEKVPKIFNVVSGTCTLGKVDLLLTSNTAFKKALKDERIILTTWRELMEKRMKVNVKVKHH